jgi:hypothetical protein
VCGEAALKAGPDDAGQWITQIRRLADDPDFSARIRQAGKLHAARFTWDAAAKNLGDLLGLSFRKQPVADDPIDRAPLEAAQ